jgi:hypothetical protein
MASGRPETGGLVIDLSGVSLELVLGETRVTGATSTGQDSVGRRVSWTMSMPGGPDLPVWETLWATGIREVVLGRGEVLPQLPAALANLIGRRRSQFSWDERVGGLLTAVRLVRPDANQWPRFTSCDFPTLEEECGAGRIELLRQIGVRQIASKSEILGDVGRSRAQLCAVIDESATEAPVAVHLVTRVVPTLIEVGFIAEAR